MSSQSKKKKNRELEAQAAALVGKHVSREKQRVLLVVTLIACALPLLLGVRLWDRIPELVHTGLIGTDGSDDSISRGMVVFGLPGLMCLLDGIAHFTLRMNQKRMTIPPAYSRLVGRWGFPIVSVVFCSGMILQAAGEDLTLTFLTPCVIGLVLLFLGAHMWDCKKDSKLALRLTATQSSEAVWKSVHRFAGWLWMAVGLAVIAAVMLTAGSTWLTGVIVILAIFAPFVYARTQAEKIG